MLDLARKGGFMALPRRQAIQKLLELEDNYGDGFRNLHPAGRIKILKNILAEINEEYEKNYDITESHVHQVGDTISQMPYRQKIAACRSLLELL